MVQDNAGIRLSSASPDTIREVSRAISDILSAPHCDEETKQLAIRTLQEVAKAPTNTSISNCTFTV